MYGSRYSEAKSLVRVALDVENIGDLAALQRGLSLLNQADPAVEVSHAENGELVLAAAGEVHIDRCLTDLRQTYCPGIAIHVSKPIVPFRETIVPIAKVDMTKEAISTENQQGVRQVFLLDAPVDDSSFPVMSCGTSNRHWTLRVRAVPLPRQAVLFLEGCATHVRAVVAHASDRHAMPLSEADVTFIADFPRQLQAALCHPDNEQNQ